MRTGSNAVEWSLPLKPLPAEVTNKCSYTYSSQGLHCGHRNSYYLFIKRSSFYSQQCSCSTRISRRFVFRNKNILLIHETCFGRDGRSVIIRWTLLQMLVTRVQWITNSRIRWYVLHTRSVLPTLRLLVTTSGSMQAYPNQGSHNWLFFKPGSFLCEN